MEVSSQKVQGSPGLLWSPTHPPPCLKVWKFKGFFFTKIESKVGKHVGIWREVFPKAFQWVEASSQKVQGSPGLLWSLRHPPPCLKVWKFKSFYKNRIKGWKAWGFDKTLDQRVLRVSRVTVTKALWIIEIFWHSEWDSLESFIKTFYQTDKDTNSILADNDNRAILGNVAMKVAPSGGQLCNYYQVAPTMGQICN